VPTETQDRRTEEPLRRGPAVGVPFRRLSGPARMTAYLANPETLAKLKDRAKSEGISLSELTRRATEIYLQNGAK
jgi:hypothetical protein